jgi:hypothetical protein
VLYKDDGYTYPLPETGLNQTTQTHMKRAILAFAAIALMSSCSKQPIGILSIPIYEEDIQRIQEAKAANTTK